MSGGWCVQLQGGGGSRRGASASDDNAADVRTSPRVCGMIRRAGPNPQVTPNTAHVRRGKIVERAPSPHLGAVRSRD
ncbi:hypothetical protein E6R61_13350 [Streptomyces sp. LRa12]|nr:hypothetical protein FQ762_23280 [Streptomyces coelicolor A3(2)]THA95593.1 hypothetical protein E6R61_13350 [Streptomyces sp. LRa12]